MGDRKVGAMVSVDFSRIHGIGMLFEESERKCKDVYNHVHNLKGIKIIKLTHTKVNNEVSTDSNQDGEENAF